MKSNLVERISLLGREFSDATIKLHEAIAGSAGLTGTDHKYLGLLLRNGPSTAGELGKLTGLTTGSVTALVDRLEEKQLVRRVFSNTDRRKVIIEPDAAAAARLLGPAFELLQKKVVALVGTLTAADREIVARYLQEAITVMDDVRTTLTR